MMHPIARWATLLAAGAICASAWGQAAEPTDITDTVLVNPSFDEGMDDAGVPVGWSRYAGGGVDQSLELVEVEGIEGSALVISDGDPGAEVGVYQNIEATGGQTFRVTVQVRKIGNASTAGSYVHIRFLPAPDSYEQRSLSATSADRFNAIELYGMAPEGTTSARVYLYTHAAETPKVMVDAVKIESGVEMPPPPPPPPPPAPEPIPPQFEQLKDMHLNTDLVRGGEASVAIVRPALGAYDAEAAAIADAIEKISGVRPPVIADDSEGAAVPIAGNLVCLGNRSTNATINGLYDKFFTLLDLKYPGPGGHVVRTLHSPFGDGRNVVLVGGSDAGGVAAGTQVLVAKLGETGGGQGELSLGRLAEIELGAGVVVPSDVTEVKIWEESATYGSSGYFGWNVISKHMALYYMTGDETHLDEFMRLSFPDAEAIKQLEEMDGERIENKHDPLAGPYHYSAHMMILFWDLIEESPYFSDEDRLEVTNALSRQLTHRAAEHVYGITRPSSSVGNRHGDWAAMSLYALARYFDLNYPDPIWTCALDSVKLYFQGLERSAWLAGMNDHLFWYTSYYDPMLDYMIMSGDRPGVENGNLAQALATQDILFTGNLPDWGVRASSLNYLLRAAYLTGDGRFLYYMDRTELDTDTFRLGQSYWPDESLAMRQPTELVNAWTMQPMPEPMWAARGKALPLANQFLWGAYRNTLDQTGDYLLIKGHNGGGRNPYHTFVPLELRIGGYTLLKSYQTQVLTSADGMVEPVVAMDSQLLGADVLGSTVTAVGDTPKAAFCDWKRTLALRTGEWCLFVDDLGFRTDSANVEVVTKWHAVGGTWIEAAQKLAINGSGGAAPAADGTRFRALENECTCGPGTAAELLSALSSIDMMLLKAKEPGVWVEMAFALDEPMKGEVLADLLNYTDRGNVRLWLDGEVAVEEVNHYAQSAISTQVSLGERELAAGEHRLRMEITGKREDSARMYGGLLGVTIRPEGVPAPPPRPQFELHPSDPQQVTSGSVVTMKWRGAVANEEHKVFFHLLGGRMGEEELGCLKLAANAAALSLPEPGIAVVGEYGDIAGELAVVSGDHAYGRGVTKLAGLLESSVPVDVDWDLVGGALEIVATEDAELRLAADGQEAVKLTAGRHALEQVMPTEAAASGLRDRLAAAVAEARQERERMLAEGGTEQAAALPELAATATGNVGGKPVASLTYESDAGEMLAVAEGQTVHVLAADGSEVRALATDGEIKCMTWWEEHRLLVVGCKDEKVIAFDESGARVWEFVSEMDRAVWEAAKQYWFKSAYPGIHGLATGVFMDGKSQCFVGSACTLEILDETGALVNRMPVFWGPGWKFQLVDGPADTVNLLVARWPNGTDSLAIVNSDGPKLTGRGYYGVPEGHTMIGGWTALNRTGIEYVDVDGDGARELVSAENGVWNRVTVFSGAGVPLHNAQFGPGATTPYANLRDMAVADLDGDGDMEIVVATAGGLVVALDHQCERLWSTRTPAPPTQLEVVGQTVVVGCEGGQVVRMSGDGEMTAAGQANGRIERMEVVGGQIVVATATGEVKTFGE